MKTVISHVVTFLILISQNALAEPLYEIRPIEFDHPIRICKPVLNPRVRHHISQAISQAQKSFRCGNLEDTYENLLVALEGVEGLLNTQAKGWCYSNANCRRPLVAPRLVTKAHCKDTGIAESWIRQSPTVGTCVNL